MNNLNDFLQYIHRGQDSIVKSHDGKVMKIIKNEKIKLENSKGDIYFVVNTGGDKDSMIKNYNAAFIDLDCGKIKGGSFHSSEIVNKYKQDKIQEIKSFPLPPTFIVETRNGLHAYWILEDCVDGDKWKLCIDKLIKKFNGDPVVKNAARLMRLPFTYWMKDKDNPFYVNIIEFNDVVYDINGILNSLSDIEVKSIGGGGLCGYSIMKCKDTYNTITTKTLPLIIDNEIEALQHIFKVEPIEFQTENEFYVHITQNIDLFSFLGVKQGEPFKCIFHDDKNPSAGIFISNRGQYFYKCHSCNCGFKGNIIRCVEKLKKLKSRPDAINFIKKVFKLSIEDNEWKRKQKAMLEDNKRMIREGEFEEYYPDVYKLIKNYLDLFYLMHDIAIDNIYDEKLTDDSNNVVFFTSVTRIMEMLNYKNRTKISDRNALFSFLKLLNKLSDAQIPETYLKKANEVRLKNKQFYNVSFFSIPSYCNDLMEESEVRANMYKDNNVSMRGWSRELLLRTFGEDVANESYPQFSQRKVSNKSQKVTKEIHELIIMRIEEKGYATEAEVIEEIVIENLKKGNKVKESSQTQIKKSLQEMLDTYDLERVRVNKLIKEQYGIAGNGYPFIIVKKK